MELAVYQRYGAVVSFDDAVFHIDSGFYLLPYLAR